MTYTYEYWQQNEDNTKFPIYVGKGNGDRIYHHLNAAKEILQGFAKRRDYSNADFINRLIHLILVGQPPEIKIVLADVSNTEASVEEIRRIALYGRRHLGTGTLFNLTAGGDGGSYTWTKEQREVQQQKNRAKAPRISATLKAFYQTRRGMELREKYSQHHLGGVVKHSATSIELMRQAKLGKAKTAEACANMSKAALGRRLAKKTKQKLREKSGAMWDYHYRVTSPEGEVMTLDSTTLGLFCEEKKLSHKAMLIVAAGYQQTHKGWKVERL